MTAYEGHVLIVEESGMLGATIKDRFESDLHLEVALATGYDEAQDLLSGEHPEFSIAVVDTNLPDIPDGPVMELVQSKGIPAIVLTSGVSDGLQEDFWKRRIVDYVLKGSTNSLDHLTALVRRINRNRSIESLVVSELATARKRVCGLLQAHQYRVLEAESAAGAISVMDEHPAIKLMLVDCEMPGMNGTRLAEQVRQTHGPDELAIVGLSGSGGGRLAAKILKSGANDIVSEPFEVEEFYCRITQNIELLEHMTLLRDASNRDSLTGLSDRRGFFETAEKLHANAQRGNLSAAIALIGIDHFKQVNDDYGHEAGKAVLRRIGWVLRERFRQADVVSRYGEDEFCVLATNLATQQARRLFEGVRRLIEAETVHCSEEAIRVTVSIGISLAQNEPLEEVIRHADEKLCAAKEAGGNRILL
jgi:diguanylate cyclase (GGDEF)-like protein